MSVALLDVACPLVGDVGLELGGLACAWAVGDVDACTQGKVVWVFVFIDWRDEVGEWVFIDVRKIVFIRVVRVDAVDARWEGIGPEI